MSFKTEIRVYNDPKFYSNGVAFATRHEAERYGVYKLEVWTMADDYQVVESDEAVNYTFTDDWQLNGITPVEVPSVEVHN